MPTRVVLLYGGQSAEHEVSTVSALHVLTALDRERFTVVPIGITRDGRWIDTADEVAALPAGAESLPSPDGSTGREIAPLHTLSALARDRDAVVLPLLHGPMGEDGTVQGLCELLGVPYVGAGVLGSAVCMDKPTSKAVLQAYGLPIARWLAARARDAGPSFAEGAADALGFPVFVKPANLGSSVGVTRATDLDGLIAAIEVALKYDEYVIVEEAVVGREIEVAVLGNDDPIAAVPGEIRPSHEFYDFDDKYVDGAADLIVPARLSDAEADEVRALAVAAYRALRVDGMGRVDFFYEESGRGFLVNEINTIPGFTRISMYPKLWDASGVPFPRLVERLVECALARHATRAGFSTGRR